jgi:hypothetical protein
MAATTEGTFDASLADRIFHYLSSIQVDQAYFQQIRPYDLAAHLVADNVFVPQVSFDANKNSIEDVAYIIQQYINSRILDANHFAANRSTPSEVPVQPSIPVVTPFNDPAAAVAQEKGAAKKGRMNWTMYESEMVNEQMKQHEEMLLDKSVGIKFRTMSAAEKFLRISERLAQLNPPVNRTATQIETKWEKLAADFKKVFDWDKSTPSGQPSYWDMPPEMKKDNRMPPAFSKPLFLR